MDPGNPAPAKREQAPEYHEGDEGEVNEEDELGESFVEHGLCGLRLSQDGATHTAAGRCGNEVRRDAGEWLFERRKRVLYHRVLQSEGWPERDDPQRHAAAGPMHASRRKSRLRYR